jgi:hypothetical protein
VRRLIKNVGLKARSTVWLILEDNVERRVAMPEDLKPIEPAPPEPPEPELDEETGDFITRHVLEKDSVFFEG